MKNVLRGCLLGLLVCGGSVQAYELSTYLSVGSILFAAQETGPKIVKGVKEYAPQAIELGGKLITTGKEMLGNGAQMACDSAAFVWNKTAVPVYNNGTVATATTTATLSFGGIINEFFFKNKETTSGYNAGMYALSFATSALILVGKMGLWVKGVESKDEVIKS